jgi:hypothetical protein
MNRVTVNAPVETVALIVIHSLLHRRFFRNRRKTSGGKATEPACIL